MLRHFEGKRYNDVLSTRLLYQLRYQLQYGVKDHPTLLLSPKDQARITAITAKNNLILGLLCVIGTAIPAVG